MSETAAQPTTENIFDTKYTEFANELAQCLPELEKEIAAAKALFTTQRLSSFKDQVLPTSGNPRRDGTVCPGAVLPGVIITDELWSELSDGTQRAIQEYLTLLSVCCLFDTGMNDPKMWEGTTGWGDDFMNTWKDKMDGGMFAGLAEKMGKMFGEDGSNIPKLPEKFLKGHIAKLAEELVRDFKPEDFGFTPSEIASLEKDPARAFEMMMKMYTTKPDLIQKSIQKIGKRLQQKIASGQINPKQIAAEAEELLKTFTDNPAFSSLMESFRGMFGMGAGGGDIDPDLLRSVGRENDARMSIVKERLRRKLEQKKAAAAGGSGAAGGGAGGPDPTGPSQKKEKPAVSGLFAPKVNKKGPK
jgi:hypothetical protein